MIFPSVQFCYPCVEMFYSVSKAKCHIRIFLSVVRSSVCLSHFAFGGELVFFKYLIMPPVKEGGANCFAHVGPYMSVSQWVCRSLCPYTTTCNFRTLNQ